MQKIFYYALLANIIACQAADDDDDDSTPGTGDGVYFIGHSQVNHEMPGYFNWTLASNNEAVTVERQVIAGANLEENFILHGQTSDSRSSGNDPDSKYLYFDGRISNKGTDSLSQIGSGNYGHIVMTEEHGLTQAQIRASDFVEEHDLSFPTAEYVFDDSDGFLTTTYQPTYGRASGLGFYHAAVSAVSTAKVYLYENWFPHVNGQTHCNRMDNDEQTKTLAEFNSWRERILAYKPGWEALASEINERRGSTQAAFSYGNTSLSETTIASGEAVEVIPVGQALSVLVEEICAGDVATLTNPNALFVDHAHASQLANYFIAMVMYASIFDRTPASLALSGSGTGEALDGSTLSTPDSDVAERLREIAWDVVSGTSTANDTAITSCSGISDTSINEEQYCADREDDETIPQY